MRRRLLGLCALVVAGCGGGGAPDEPPPASEGSRLDVRSLSVGGTGVSLGEGARLDGALSLLLLGQTAGSARLRLGVQDEAGRWWIDPERPAWGANRALPGRGTATALLPSAWAALPLATDYRASVVTPDDPAGTAVPVTLFVKWPTTPGRTPAVQELPYTLVLVGSAPSDGRRAAAFAVAARAWRAAGVVLKAQGVVTLPAADAAGSTRLAIDPSLGSDSPALGALLSLSSRIGADPGLPLFVVPRIDGGAGAGIWALAGGIPAAPAAGTRRSGIAIDAALFDLSADRAGQILAHEIGHALGLFHTTEATFVSTEAGAPAAPVHDQLPDTPACPADADRPPADGRLDETECAAYDAHNLMFWATAPGATLISPQQGEIARRSPLTR